MNKNIIIYTPLGQIAGIVNSKIYHTTKDPTRHFFRKYNGYGISNDILDKLDILNVYLVRIKEKGTGTIYDIKLKQFLNSRMEFNFSGDKQKFVSISKYKSKLKDLSNFFEVKE